jgi:RimJ/RimL family protein N-acetyltransferase
VNLSAVDLATEVVRSPRLVLRPWRPEDEDAVFQACQDTEIQRWIGVIPVPYRREDARAFVTETAPGERAKGRGLSVAVESAGRVVGSAGIGFDSGRFGPEIGYWIAPEARGHGYAAETARALADWAFAHEAPRVHLVVDLGNAASQAAARRAGFAQEGVVRSCLEYRDGSRGDAVLFGRVAGD